MIEQLAFQFFQPVPNLIVLGKDPLNNDRTLLRCPCCNEVRSIHNKHKSRYIQRQTSVCKNCAAIHIGLARRSDIPTSDDCIILEQYHEIRSKSWCALVVCPDCKTEYVKLRRNIISDSHTVCGACIHRRKLAKPLPQSEECIIIEAFAATQGYAFVECPRCHKQFEKDRRYILRDKHTICHYCSVVKDSGHLLLQGGRHLLELSPELIILGKDLENPSRWLARCPICHKTRSLTYAGAIACVERQNSTCNTCASRRTAKPLPRSEKCIIIQEFAPGYSVKHATALVECPRCHKQFQKDRHETRRDGHTICHTCSRPSGEAHYAWQGGGEHYYGPGWYAICKKVRERDDHTCQWPGCTKTSETNGRLLDVHHIIAFRKSRYNSPANLVSLCPSHHKYAEHHLDESIPLLQAIVKERLKPTQQIEHDLVGKTAA